MSEPRFNYDKRKHSRKTRNFTSVCEEIAREGKTYAEWQKERYSALYDVKTSIRKRNANRQHKGGIN